MKGCGVFRLRVSPQSITLASLSGQSMTAFGRGMDPEAHFRFFERGSPNDVQVKAWCQPTTGVNLAESGGHDARFPARSIHPEKFVLKHYPIRNLEQGRRKIFAERLGRFHPDERAVGWHVQYDHFQRDGLRLWNSVDLLEWGRDSVRHC